jgi:hypothetical protein
MFEDYTAFTCFRCNGNVYDENMCPEDCHCFHELTDPDKAKAHFIDFCVDPVPQEEEKHPYDDLTYPAPMPEDQYFDEE